MTGSTAVAAAVVHALLGGGVTDVVLAPGSRSAALAMAFHASDLRGELRLHVRIDERSAGFLALGLTKGSHRPVAVVTTSGTAVANLHPAILEARHTGAPLIVLSADRPAALRGTGANQTTEQAGLFGGRVAWVDISPGEAGAAGAAVSEAVRRQGPTQVNLQFTEPLLSDNGSPGSTTEPTDLTDLNDLSDPTETELTARQQADPRVPVLDPAPRTVVVAGDDAGPPARLLAEAGNWPLLAEPTSGARTGTQALRAGRLLLETGLVDQIERVIVTGHPTVSRPVTALISRSDLEVLAVRGRSGIATDPGRVATHLASMPTVTGPADPEWFAAWQRADQRTSSAVDEFVAHHAAAEPLRVAAEVAAAVSPRALLVVGSSQPVRDLDLMMRPNPVGERRRILGNRGLAGIDGTVSTAIGAALGRRSSRALAYLGDLTFLHDATGLVLGPSEPRPDLTIVVANDDGGSIFAMLEQGAPAYADSFERLFGTPHGVDMAALCAATRTTYVRANDATTLRDVLTTPSRGIRVVEVPIPRSGRRALDTALRDLAGAVQQE